MKITIGGATEDCMLTLGIQSYPFTSRELSMAFRTKLKEVHPDTANDGGTEKKQNEQTRKVIEAYKRLKNLSVDPEEFSTKIEIEEGGDIFKLYDVCPKCHGRRTETIVIGGYPCSHCSSGLDSIFFMFRFYKSRGYNYKSCGLCGGSGSRNGKVCVACNGVGRVKQRCPYCKGIGFLQEKVERRACSNCGGRGKVEINPWNPVIPKGAVLGR